MPTIAEDFETALRHYWAGQWATAAQFCRQVLDADPRHARAMRLLARSHEAGGDLRAAEDACRQATVLQPNHAEAQCLLGSLLRKRGEREAALACYERAVASDPNYFEAQLKLGSLLRECGQIEPARAAFHRAIRLRPDAAQAHCFLGNLEAFCGRWARANECYEQAIRLNPNYAAAQTRLAVVLQSQGQLAAAILHYRRALELDPSSAEAHYNLGRALSTQGNAAEAVEHYELTLVHRPDHGGAHINLGAFYQESGDDRRALAHYDLALEVAPDSAEAHYNRALILLTQGNLAAGWPEYQARLRMPNFPIRVMNEPLWDGSPIADKTLLVHGEQGLGDTLHFIRYVRAAQARCAKVLLRVQAPLVALLAQAGFEHLSVDGDQLPHFDYQAPLLNLPGVFGTTLANIPADVPYLSVREDAIVSWRDRLSRLGGLRVGIVWKGSSTHIGDHARSIPLVHFGPLARVEGVTLVSLQKGEGIEQLRDIDFVVHQLDGAWDEAAGPFMDTAAVIKNLDLVVSTDTAIAHLAGGLGVPVWVALAIRADWRWFRDRDETPWYPTMRLFRQARRGDWQELFVRIAGELEQVRNAKRGRS